MGLFDLFKKKKFTDKFFGELSYTTFNDPLKNFYDGQIIFDSKMIAVDIDADENGPTKEQREFFIRLQDGFENLKKDILFPFLKKELVDWYEKSELTDFDQEFIIDGLSIPRLPDSPVRWSLTFDALRIKHWVTIDFIDFEPQRIIVDG